MTRRFVVSVHGIECDLIAGCYNDPEAAADRMRELRDHVRGGGTLTDPDGSEVAADTLLGLRLWSADEEDVALLRTVHVGSGG